VVSYDNERSAPDGNTDSVVEGDIQVKAYPNPFSSKAIIEFQNIQSSSYVVVEIYDLKGAKIATLFDGEIERGVLYKAEINAGNLLEGVYIYRILNGEQIVSGKLLLIK